MSFIFNVGVAEDWLRENPDVGLEQFLEYHKSKKPDLWAAHPARLKLRATSLYTRAAENITIAVRDDLVLNELDDDGPDVVPGGVVYSAEKDRETLKPGRYVFTSAQSNTKVHPVLASLQHYCDKNDAKMHIATFTYNKTGHSEHSVKLGSKKVSDNQDVWFDQPVIEFISDISLQVAPDLVFCGELNILPTRINPLSSFSTYTRQNSAIIPHAKLAMQSIPTMKNEPPRFLYSTGSCTLRNYIQKTAGQVADFHHVFGALVVEVAENGTWWARQLNADDDGTFYDLNWKYTPDGAFMHNETNLAINHGDIHWNKRDPHIMGVMFGPGGILDKLAPEYQFFHDIVDFQARNHHNIQDPHFIHQMLVEGTDSVQKEFCEAGEFLLTNGYRSWCKTFVVESNHDMAIDIWLRNIVGASDPANARIWHEWNAQAYRVREAGEKPRPFKSAIEEGMMHFQSRAGFFHGTAGYDVRFLHEDDSLWLKSIQFGLHGHLGPNGARGAPKNLRSVGKANTGHTHSAGIVDGVYTAGLFGLMDQGYNKGLSGWSASFILTYPNGKRTIITIKDGKGWL